MTPHEARIIPRKPRNFDCDVAGQPVFFIWRRKIQIQGETLCLKLHYHISKVQSSFVQLNKQMILSVFVWLPASMPHHRKRSHILWLPFWVASRSFKVVVIKGWIDDFVAVIFEGGRFAQHLCPPVDKPKNGNNCFQFPSISSRTRPTETISFFSHYISLFSYKL